MTILEKELQIYQYVKIPEIPTFTGKGMSLSFFFCISPALLTYYSRWRHWICIL